jgi:F-type H+-transporting ATPase subunit epsilon
MAEDLKLDILTPTGAKREGIAVQGVEIPGIEGELGVLPHHESLITAIVPGIIRFKEGPQSVRIAVGPGFLEIKEQGRVVILVEQAKEPDEIETDSLRPRLKELESTLAKHTGSVGDAEYQMAKTEHAWIDAQLRAAKG